MAAGVDRMEGRGVTSTELWRRMGASGATASSTARASTSANGDVYEVDMNGERLVPAS